MLDKYRVKYAGRKRAAAGDEVIIYAMRDPKTRKIVEYQAIRGDDNGELTGLPLYFGSGKLSSYADGYWTITDYKLPLRANY